MQELFKCVVLTDKESNDYKLSEFLSLMKTAGYETVKIYHQNNKEINTKTYLGIGKIYEINEDIISSNIIYDYILCDFSLTALQEKNLSEIFQKEVYDRTFIILKIFEMNAKSQISKLQVEIAKFNYLKSRLVNDKAYYSQVTSGSKKNKGEGEKKIELNRRKIDNTINFKKKQLEEIKLSRRTMRKKRSGSPYPLVVIVGYTNAGKSTLLNRLIDYAHEQSEKHVYSKDELFATLETSTRLIESHNFPSFIAIDTVGFISDLPIFLVDAFKSTLEEIKEADLILQVVDISSPNYSNEIKTTNDILSLLEVNDIPMLYLLNKSDRVKEFTSLPKENELYTSFLDNSDIPNVLSFLWERISRNWVKKQILFPYEKDFYQFKKDNYVTNVKEKEDGYLCLTSFNPLTIYKYQNLLDI